MKKTNLLLVLLACVSITLAGCASGKKSDKAMMEPTAETATAAIKAADAARKKAASVGGEWRDTGKFIKQAQAAAKEKDYAKAIKLATKAEAEGHLGYEQAVSQKELRLPSYLPYNK